MMKDFPSCFGENGVQIADSLSSNGSKTAQNLVACVYRCRIRCRHCLITVTWSKNLMGQGLSVGIDNESASSQCLCKVDIKPWVFSKRKGCKSLEACSCKIDIHWDLSSAKFGSGPEPSEGFYVGVVVDQQMILLLGNLRKEALKKTNAVPSPSNAVLVAKKEHVFGKLFCTKAVFYDNGPIHDLVIECDTTSVTDPSLIICIDNKTVMQVNRLRWKFRGNQTIMIDGIAVEVFWDVHNMLFDTPLGNNAIFMFRTYYSEENSWASQPLSDANMLQWSFSNTKSQSRDFSLILYAWKNMHGCRNSNT
ncbi:hypothetical protein Lal_00017169 [Lupinus albus]|uniref:Uncharacterized protein n=1 Tax=Lupinus albus TaxID=3870 RepID=A0A6A4QR16_LUPAL|nr:hypothetical protein Lalb_Chr04g0261081 [Lupinus albus]KAF1869594.1 hypothetical protein Lal_00017169 [Lupinus albus]